MNWLRRLIPPTAGGGCLVIPVLALVALTAVVVVAQLVMAVA